MARINLTDEQFDAILDAYIKAVKMEQGHPALEARDEVLEAYAKGQQDAITAVYAIVTSMDISNASVNLYFGRVERIREEREQKNG